MMLNIDLSKWQEKVNEAYGRYLDKIDGLRSLLRPLR